MTDVLTFKLPHGSIPMARVRDSDVRNALMQINENVRKIQSQLAAVQKAVRELQGRS